MFSISFLLLRNKLIQTQQLKTTCIYYPTVSVGQGSRHSLAGSSAQGFTWLQSRCRSGCVFIWRLNWGRICFQAHSECWHNSLPYSSLQDFEAHLSAGCQLEAAHKSQRPPLVPCHMVLSMGNSYGCWLPQGGQESFQRQCSQLESYNVITGVVTSHHFYHILSDRSNSQVITCTQGEGIIERDYLEEKIIGVVLGSELSFPHLNQT